MLSRPSAPEMRRPSPGMRGSRGDSLPFGWSFNSNFGQQGPLNGPSGMELSQQDWDFLEWDCPERFHAKLNYSAWVHLEWDRQAWNLLEWDNQSVEWDDAAQNGTARNNAWSGQYDEKNWQKSYLPKCFEYKLCPLEESHFFQICQLVLFHSKFKFFFLKQRGEPMIQPQNVSMPPSEFLYSSGFPSSDGNNMQGGGGHTQTDANQKLWVETKAVDGKLTRVFKFESRRADSVSNAFDSNCYQMLIIWK